eukprot:Phypoly_transcript_03948.p1 GENE.Phypoly_transcript_03948~~Phypoly_transcript_03948.p1  ORF type:complete len:364 (+),score=35.56 Phypoly_transcript_03948:1025-2116(+)
MESNFVCCICHKIPSNVVESECCNSLFCWDCVIGKPQPCPSCGATIDASTCAENLAVKKIIDSIEVKCSFSGCNERYLVINRSAHEATCPKGSTLCPNSDLCGIMERGVLAQHLLSCQFRLIECHMCEMSLPLPHLQEHLDTSCQEVVAECQLCMAKLLRKNIPSHTELSCPCVETECPFAPYGCTERPLRGQVDVHVSDSTALHVRLMATAFHAQQIQINTLREQLAMTQEAASSLPAEPGVLYQFDQRLTAFVNEVKNSEQWNSPFMTNVRSQATPRRVVAALVFTIFLLKLMACLIFSHRCALLWAGMRLVKTVVKCALIVLVCGKVVMRAWRYRVTALNDFKFLVAVIALSVLVHVLLF